MTRAIISFDTELSAGLFQRGADARANFESSILGRCREGDFGIFFQMDLLERHRLTGVFFVDPMPALVYGPAVIDAILAARVDENGKATPESMYGRRKMTAPNPGLSICRKGSSSSA